MKGKCFIDSNVFIYAFSSDDAIKKKKSLELITTLSDKGLVVISTQVMNEIAAQLFRKKEVKTNDLRKIIDFLSSFETERTNFETIIRAIEIKSLYQFSYWDSLIISAAEKMNCKYLITEDLSNGQTINSLNIHNPFK